jgi:DNA repair photolyase
LLSADRTPAKLTRGCLEVLAELRNPVAVITKNLLVTRDMICCRICAASYAAVFISLTTLDNELRRVMEPRTSPLAARLALPARSASRHSAGRPSGAVIPGLTDHEIRHCWRRTAGASRRICDSRFTAVAPLFQDWLTSHFPDRSGNVLNRCAGNERRKPALRIAFRRGVRGKGHLRQSIRCSTPACRKHANFNNGRHELSTAAFRRPSGKQLNLL